MKKMFAAIVLSALSASVEAAGFTAGNDREPLAQAKMTELLGASYVPALSATDPDFAAMRDRLIYGDILQQVKLDPKICVLISLAAATAAAAPTYVREQALAALRLNVEPQIIKEAVYQTAPYVGFPKAEAALNEINALFEERGIKLAAESLATVSEADRFDKGRDLQVGAYGERILKMHREAQPEESYLSVYLLSSFCFSDIYTRNGLDMKTRELLTFSAIAVIGGAEGQLTGHTIANFNEGNSKQDLMDTIALCLPYMGFPRSLNALAVIKKVEAERNAGK